jgi:hypothetical protein
MTRYNSIEEFAQHTDVDTLLDIQQHVNMALEQIREDSLKKGSSGNATANISVALYEDQFLLIEFNYSWDEGKFVDDEEVTLTILSIDEWLDYYNLHKGEFKLVKADE